MSPDGKSYAFDSRGNGFGRGEGVATLIIKRLKDAVAAGDPVRAVIRETLLNQDGKKDSITSPSQAAQAKLMRDCYQKAGLDPVDTQYFEAHGTGTKVGDPIEVGAIASVFQLGKPSDQRLRIGSIKTNIGHTEVTSGLAAIIKVVLSLENSTIPPSVNFEKLNPELDLTSANLEVVRKAIEWLPGRNGVRRASINSFGASGTNAHVIIESANSFINNVKPPQPSQKYKTKVLVVSARSKEACEKAVRGLSNYLKKKNGIGNQEALLENVIYTLSQRRTLFPWIAAHRIPFSRGLDEVLTALDSPQFTPTRITRRPRIGMVFTGQGAQWHAMGRELIVAYPPFKAALEEAESYLKELGAGWSLLEELHRDAESTRVNDTELSIPICVALQISLVQLLRAWGVTPTSVTSHSSGEIAAAYTVGALDYKSAMAVAYHRAILTAEKTRDIALTGAMIAIGTGVEEAEGYLSQLQSGRAVAACINSPSSVTVAGDASAVQEIEDMAKRDGVFARKLRVATAYHSHHMDPVAEPYRAALENDITLPLREGGLLDSIAFSSPVTGGRIYSVENLAQPDHWVASLTQPVRFVEAVSDMVLGDFDPSGTSIDIIIEMGPHAALGGPFKDILGLPEFNGIEIPYHSCLVRNKNARDSIQDLVAILMRAGQPFDLGPINFPWGKWPHVQVISDLPSYPWDHKTRHWHESRFNKAIRKRVEPPNELLGSPAPWTNPRIPSWRHIFRINDSPWVRDHVVDSGILYPAAGFICRAIEAMAQLSNDGHDGRSVKGYMLRDFEIQNALVLSDSDQGIEIETSFRPSDDHEIGKQGWMHFTTSSITLEDTVWTQHASGMISAQYEQSSTGFQAPIRGVERMASSFSVRSIAAEDFYSSMRSSGIRYGTSFQNISNVMQSSKLGTSEQSFAIAATEAPNSLSSSHVVHPTTLDSVIQSAYATLSETELKEGALKVPQAISRLWVANRISRESGQRFRAHASRTRYDARSLQADITVYHEDSEVSVPAIKMEGLILRSIGAGNSLSTHRQEKPWEREICNTVKWAADISLASPENLVALKGEFSSPPDPAESQIVMELRRVCIYYIEDALRALTDSDVQKLQDHHKKYYAWLVDQLQLAKAGNLGPDSTQWTQDSAPERRRRIETASKASVNGEMTCQVGPHIASMLRGEIAPLEVMMEGKLLYKYYSNMLKSDRSFKHAATLLQRVVHKYPRARILEVGGGTGGETRYALKALGTAKKPKASLYHFTDVSAAFFEAAAMEFSEWKEIMQFGMFDAERDPSTQGFEAGSYDVVIACQVLHATKSMANTMANVRKLLRPGGTLLMVETTKDMVDVQFTFGLVPGWWLSEEKERSSSPSLSVSFWDEILKGADFTGVDLEVHDCESEELYSFSTIMSTAKVSQRQNLTAEDVVLVTSDRVAPPSGWQDAMQAAIDATTSKRGHRVPVHGLESTDASSYTGKICIFLGEVDQALLLNLGQHELDGIKSMVTSCKGLLWVTRGGAITSDNPNHGLAVGLMRTLRNEYVGRKFLTLDLDPNAPAWTKQSVSTILKVLQAEFRNTHSTFAYGAPDEFEYAERHGEILVPRLQEMVEKNEQILPDSIEYTQDARTTTELFHALDCSLSLKIGVPGVLETLSFTYDDETKLSQDVIPDNIVQIEPRAFGVSQRDAMAALGQLDDYPLGSECAGIITKAGNFAASKGYRPGDRVFGLIRGSLSNRVRTDWTNLQHIPSKLSFEQAASVPVAFSVAYIALFDMARIRKSQSVLIHAAAGGVGQAAIAVAKRAGATIFVTVGSSEKKAFIVTKCGIPDYRVFSSRDESFVERVLTATNGRGVDVVLNSLPGSLLQSTLGIIAPFGHFIEIGAQDTKRNSSMEMRPFSRQMTFSTLDLRMMMQHRPEEVHRSLAEITRMLEDDTITLEWPITTFSIMDTAQAFSQMIAGKHVGKMVLRSDTRDTVCISPRRKSLRLSPVASYLLIGGIGGIGRSLAVWMAEQGARNLILLSRSAANSQKARSFVARMTEETGCRIKAISCDASSNSELGDALRECKQDGFPPIRGIIQGAMVLQVRSKPCHLVHNSR